MIVIRIFLWLIILGVVASPVVAWYGLEDTPMVTESAEVSVRDIQSAKDFLKQYDPRNLPDGRITTITANQGQINTALAAALSAVPQFKARIVPSRFGLLAAITGEAPLPANPFGRYLNISMLVESSTEGLKIGRLSIGEIEIPTVIVRPVFIMVMDQVAGPGRGKAFLDTIRSVQVTGTQVQVVYRPKEGLLDELKTAAKETVVAGDATITRGLLGGAARHPPADAEQQPGIADELYPADLFACPTAIGRRQRDRGEQGRDIRFGDVLWRYLDRTVRRRGQTGGIYRRAAQAAPCPTAGPP